MKTNEQIIKDYYNNNQNNIWIKQRSLKELLDTKESLLTELTIATRMWHQIEESYIRYKLEVTITYINIIENFNFNIE